MTLTEELITLPTAILARNCGFDEMCTAYFFGGYNLRSLPTGLITSDDIPAPSQPLLARWIREVHHIHISISAGIQFGLTYCPCLNYLDKPLSTSGNFIVPTHQWTSNDNQPLSFPTFEEAIESGLIAALEYIKQQQNG